MWVVYNIYKTISTGYQTDRIVFQYTQAQDSRLTNVLTEAEKGLENFDEQMEPITGKKRKAGKGDK